MSHVTVGRWGKNLAIRFPGEIASTANIREGEQVELEWRGEEIVIRRVTPRFSLNELFRGRTPAEWRKDYAAAFEWGPDVGREHVEE